MGYDELRRNLSRSMKWKLAERFAKERLDYVNSNCVLIDYHDTIYTKYIKRVLDIALSGCALIITAPVNFSVGIITYFDVGKPLLFQQERIGKNEKVFVLKKFRNMTNEKGARGELLPPHQRVTKWGSFVRKTSIDELLNFWYVFKGDMSIIGPRPLGTPYMIRFNDRHRARFYVKPGLECPPKSIGSQMRTWDDQFENDVWYVENISFKTDFRMLLNLIRFTFDKKNASMRGSAERGDFIGYSYDGKALSQFDIPDEYLEWVEREMEKDSKEGAAKHVGKQ